MSLPSVPIRVCKISKNLKIWSFFWSLGSFWPPDIFKCGNPACEQNWGLNGQAYKRGYFNLSEWKTPISPNFQKNSRILEGSYLSEFQNDRGRILDFYVKNAHLYQKYMFQNSFLDEKLVKNPYTSFFLFERSKGIFIFKKENRN